MDPCIGLMKRVQKFLFKIGWAAVKGYRQLKWLRFLSPSNYLKRLDWYIVRKFIGTYVFAIALIISLAIVFDVNENLEKFSRYYVCRCRKSRNYRDYTPNTILASIFNFRLISRASFEICSHLSEYGH